MATVAEHLEHNRKELLDLSTRNRLLSIPTTSKSARLIHLEGENSADVFKKLVVDKKSLSFAAGRKSTSRPQDGDDLPDFDDSPNSPEEEEDDDSSEHSSGKRGASSLQTSLSLEGLQRRLLSLQIDAQILQEEQGVNVLFIAFGQLKWLEDASPDSDRFAPLVLVPIELKRQTAAERFKLKWTEQEIQENLSLRVKLKNDFEIALGDFEDDEDFDLSQYFAGVAKSIRGRKGWAVLPDKITVGFFSFAKLMMFRDLDPENWPLEKKIDQNELVAGLLVDGFAEESAPFDEHGHLDELIPVDRLDHVVDADGSQTVAIELVRRGQNLVIQGPPGTGKSQTICNIVSSAVLDGKRVLFVAEKLAALEVVKRRLEANGLGALCLELHSHKANKRTVLEDIGRTWKLGKPSVIGDGEILPRLDALRSKLNLHCKTLHRTLDPSGQTPFKIIGNLAKLRHAGACYIDLEFRAPETWLPPVREGIRKIVDETVQRIAQMGSPNKHPWRGSRRAAFLRIDAEPVLRKVRRVGEALSSLRLHDTQLCSYLSKPNSSDLAELKLHLLEAEQIAKAPELDREAIGNAVWEAGTQALSELVKTGTKFSGIANENLSVVRPGIWLVDLSPVREQILADGKSLIRFLKRDYRAAITACRSHLSQPPPRDFKGKIALLDRLIEGQGLHSILEASAETGKKAFGALWLGDQSDWTHLAAIAKWVEGHAALGLNAPFRKLFTSLPEVKGAGKIAGDLRGAIDRFLHDWEEVLADLNLDLLEAFGAETIDGIKFEELALRIESWSGTIENLSEWVAYHSRAQTLREQGAGCLVDALEKGSVPIEKLPEAFEWVYFSQLLRFAVKQYPDLGVFDGLLHERTVEEFRHVDRERLEFSKLRTLMAHYERMPPEGTGVGVTGVIKSEMARKRGHMPIRRLLARTGHAVQAIKPIFMMSPLSVAQYLEPGGIEFDLLVIDEASQVEPVDALGAVARSKQVVVVGDSRQLPPSHFFMRMTSESDADEIDEDHSVAARDIESILGLCLARGFQQKMLRWHYRSRHHSLIAVSNHEFYEDRLFIVPSPFPVGSGLGLQFRFIPNGIFDAGVTAVNRVEARMVAEAVMKHAGENPHTSLGVAAFSIRQRQAIQDELEVLRREKPETETFFSGHPYEPFFVKNLENVQGDERDVIFISIGYARDPNGFMAMRFGPLSVEGGERRLNVLISRAKQRCEVFSSIRSEDIDLARASGRGVAALKSFLRFAETGQMGVARQSGDEEDSPFEESVRGKLERHGLLVHTQVGESGFFIDLAISEPKLNGRYILGIECDGAAYHSSKSARDRDRLRQAVLEDHGWLIHRVWSTDWFQRPERELRRILLAVEKARELLSRQNNPAAAAPSPEEDLSAEIERTKEEELAADPYILAVLDAPTHIDLQTMAPGQLVRHIKRILEVEAPIGLDEIVTRIRDAWGFERAGNRIAALVGQAVRLAVQNSRYKLAEGFYVDSGKKPLPRQRGEYVPLSLRKPENLPPQEIRSAIVLVVERHLGVGRDELAVAVGRVFGFKATSPQLRATIDAQTRKLVRTGILSEADGVVQRVSSAMGGSSGLTERN